MNPSIHKATLTLQAPYQCKGHPHFRISPGPNRTTMTGAYISGRSVTLMSELALELIADACGERWH